MHFEFSWLTDPTVLGLIPCLTFDTAFTLPVFGFTGLLL